MAVRDLKDKPGGALDIRVGDVIDTLVKRNPSAPREKIEHTARLMATMGAMIQQWDDQSSVTGALCMTMQAGIEQAVAEATTRLTATQSGTDTPGASTPKRSRRRLALAPRRAIEAHVGVGLGEKMTADEGQRRLSGYAGQLALEEWAGPVAGSTELAARMGVARSTLQDWRRDGAVIGLLKGTRKHVFPLAQFVDGRPAPGIAETVAIVGEPRAAWLWLVESRKDGGSPLEDLKRGRVKAVLDAAREDFD